MTRSIQVALVLSGIATLFGRVAVAQEAVVIAGIGDPPAAAAAASRALGAGLASRGHAPLSADDARARLAPHRPAAFTAAPADVRDRLARAAQDTLEQVARGRHARVHELADPVLRDVQPHLAALGRDDATSRQLVDLCLFVVRSALMQHDAVTARARATDCVRMVPTLEPSAAVHPTDVRALVTEVRGASHATLAITTAASEASGCAVRVNGAIVGRTPSVRAPLPEGDYAVQVECTGDTPGAVRRIAVPATGVASLAPTPGIDRALGPDGLSLRYASAAELRDQAVPHAATLASMLGVPEVLLVVPESGDAVRIDRVRVGDERADAAASTRVRAAGGQVSAAEATRALDALEGRGGAGGGGDGVGVGGGVGGGDSAPRIVEASGGGGRAVLGPVLLGTAGLALAGVVVGTLAMSGCTDRYPEGDCMNERKVRVLETSLAAGGAALALGGALVWFLASGGHDSDEEDVRGIQVSISPTGAAVHGTF